MKVTAAQRLALSTEEGQDEPAGELPAEPPNDIAGNVPASVTEEFVPIVPEPTLTLLLLGEEGEPLPTTSQGPSFMSTATVEGAVPQQLSYDEDSFVVAETDTSSVPVVSSTDNLILSPSQAAWIEMTEGEGLAYSEPHL
eukprot:TRINITY_DN4363_c0_g1_i3.p1 TRINITY_DN4363_c0_g1~~TRINITY_DN4363_c0_g1_i3.p1  ORF type:complete len:140 (+),score=23.43 TRINITY_DN4363_c0_g1_i3:381-800(+)